MVERVKGMCSLEKYSSIIGINELGLEITDKQVEQFFKYYEMLINTNKVMNLTSIVFGEDWFNSLTNLSLSSSI